jgi:hypothetical protein
VNVPHEVDATMVEEEELGRTAVLCAISGNAMDLHVFFIARAALHALVPSYMLKLPDCWLAVSFRKVL